MTRRTRSFEPWPWILAGMLVAMIGTSISFLFVALSHPDPEVERPALRSTGSTPPASVADEPQS